MATKDEESSFGLIPRKHLSLDAPRGASMEYFPRHPVSTRAQSTRFSFPGLAIDGSSANLASEWKGHIGMNSGWFSSEQSTPVLGVLKNEVRPFLGTVNQDPPDPHTKPYQTGVALRENRGAAYLQCAQRKETPEGLLDSLLDGVLHSSKTIPSKVPPPLPFANTMRPPPMLQSGSSDILQKPKSWFENLVNSMGAADASDAHSLRQIEEKIGDILSFP